MEHLDVVIGPESVHPFHANVIRHPLTQNIRPKFADIQDEISTAFSDNVRSGNDNGEYGSICRLTADVT